MLPSYICHMRCLLRIFLIQCQRAVTHSREFIILFHILVFFKVLAFSDRQK